jgi:hypothetical protein
VRRNLERRNQSGETAGDRLLGRLLLVVFSVILLIALYMGLGAMV